MTKRVSAKYVGTFWLVFGGCGSAVLATTSALGVRTNGGGV